MRGTHWLEPPTPTAVLYWLWKGYGKVDSVLESWFQEDTCGGLIFQVALYEASREAVTKGFMETTLWAQKAKALRTREDFSTFCSTLKQALERVSKSVPGVCGSTEENKLACV